MSGRPKIYSDLVNTTICSEKEVIDELKRKGFNISEICREAMLNATNNPVLIKKYDKFERVMPDTRKIILEAHKKDPMNVDGIVKILKRHTGVTFSALEILSWIDRNEESD